ncbi:MAG: hypothetical protein R2706_11070 [Acidimicrobiales bacterium]
MQVEIKTEALLFGKVVLPDGIIVTRLARAQFIRPVPMGNPTSQLGGGQLLSLHVPVVPSAECQWLLWQAADGSRSFSGFENVQIGCPTPNGTADVFSRRTRSPGLAWTSGNYYDLPLRLLRRRPTRRYTGNSLR